MWPRVTCGSFRHCNFVCYLVGTTKSDSLVALVAFTRVTFGSRGHYCEVVESFTSGLLWPRVLPRVTYSSLGHREVVVLFELFALPRYFTLIWLISWHIFKLHNDDSFHKTDLPRLGYGLIGLEIQILFQTLRCSSHFGYLLSSPELHGCYKVQTFRVEAISRVLIRNLKGRIQVS